MCIFFIFVTKIQELKITSLVLAFYMLIGSFIPKTDFSQLLHLSDMVEHYQLHKKNAVAQGLNFCLVDFVKVHVLSSEQHEHDNTDDHKKLPCQSPHVSVLLFSIVVKFDILDVSFPTVLNELSFQNNFHLTGFIKSLIHPPSFS